ncbi:SPL family radical SAM protein [Desulfogranum mediterraneum]|uniref:SPL family radical SAM protein n=1 Tax=Desulfogranum mediterraneum TaxID=160661 RepID=UPI000400E751|nr:deoxyribodipyrimidine photo-lyase [Desulfogranum mediterraneum]
MNRTSSYGDPARFIRQLHVAEDCRDHPYTREIIQRTKLPVSYLKPGQLPAIEGDYPANLDQGKRHLLLCRNRGVIFKPCPGTREYTCCDYQVLNIGMNCPMDCVYCILQAYLNNPWLSFFVNVDDLVADLDRVLLKEQDQFFRIGTGEFTDSLAIDSLTGFSPHLINYMRDKPNAVLELKTKCAVIDNLRGLDHNGRTVVAWSLNSTPIMAREELRTASLEERLEAAAQVAQWGYRLAFHFDPIIYHHNWQQGYRETIAKLFATVPAEKIAWISMGALRYLPALKKIATERFPFSSFFYEEFINGLDNKYRYFRPQRVAMYRFILDELKKYSAEQTCIYFCMESEEIWQEVFGFVPGDVGGLPAMLDRSVGWSG